MLAVAALSAVAAVLALPAVGTADRTVFVTNSDTPETGLAAFDAATGPLTPLAGTPVATGAEPTGVTVSPDARTAYVAELNEDSVAAFRIGAGGEPTPLGSTATGGNQPTGLATTPDGAFLLATNRDSTDTAPSVSVLAIDPGDGTLSPVSSSPENLGIFDPRGVAISPDGRFAYVTGRRGPLGPPPSNADVAVAVAAIGADGNLAPITGSPFFTPGVFNSFGASIAPDGSRLFVALPNNAQIQVSDLDPTTGAPTPVANSPFPTGAMSPLELSVTPDGARLYVTEAFGQAIEGFGINPATGALAQIAGTPLALGGQPQGVAVTPDGAHAYVSLLMNPGRVVGLDVGASGSLTSINGSPFASGGVFPSFFSVAVTPTQTPEVAFASDPGKPGKPTGFDAGATTVRGGLPTRFDWEFGDGTALADGGPTPTHTYAEAGVYDVELTVTNDCDPDAVFEDGVGLGRQHRLLQRDPAGGGDGGARPDRQRLRAGEEEPAAEGRQDRGHGQGQGGRGPRRAGERQGEAGAEVLQAEVEEQGGWLRQEEEAEAEAEARSEKGRGLDQRGPEGEGEADRGAHRRGRQREDRAAQGEAQGLARCCASPRWGH